MLTREAKKEVVNILLGEATDAAAQLGRNFAEHRPHGVKAARCFEIEFVVKTHIRQVRVHEANVGCQQPGLPEVAVNPDKSMSTQETNESAESRFNQWKAR
jgi:hypothetical protein